MGMIMTKKHKNNTVSNRPHKFTALLCLCIVLVMGGLAYASVPLYDLFCRVTGYGGTTKQVTQISDKILTRKMKIRFDASLNREMPWQFRPPESSIDLRIGETALVFYSAYNPTQEDITGTATFNVTPQRAGRYFSKIDCFCFREQTLKSGQSMDMPVTFFIDPEMIQDPYMDDVQTITLSYTFFRISEQAERKIDDKTPKG